MNQFSSFVLPFEKFKQVSQKFQRHTHIVKSKKEEVKKEKKTSLNHAKLMQKFKKSLKFNFKVTNVSNLQNIPPLEETDKNFEKAPFSIGRHFAGKIISFSVILWNKFPKFFYVRFLLILVTANIAVLSFILPVL